MSTRHLRKEFFFSFGTASDKKNCTHGYLTAEGQSVLQDLPPPQLFVHSSIDFYPRRGRQVMECNRVVAVVLLLPPIKNFGCHQKRHFSSNCLCSSSWSRRGTFEQSLFLFSFSLCKLVGIFFGKGVGCCISFFTCWFFFLPPHPPVILALLSLD